MAGEDKLSVLRLSSNYSALTRFWGAAQHEANVSVSAGLADFLGSMGSDGDGMSNRTGGSGALAGGDFTKLNFSYNRLQHINNLQSVLYRFDSQFTSDLLTSLEQFSLGGPNTVRAFPVAEALVDKALFVSVEWIARASPDIPQTWLNKLQLSVFFDYASGKTVDPLVNELSSLTLAGIGVSAQVEPFNNMIARIDLSLADFGETPSDKQTLPFYFRLEFPF